MDSSIETLNQQNFHIYRDPTPPDSDSDSSDSGRSIASVERVQTDEDDYKTMKSYFKAMRAVLNEATPHAIPPEVRVGRWAHFLLDNPEPNATASDLSSQMSNCLADQGLQQYFCTTLVKNSLVVAEAVREAVSSPDDLALTMLAKIFMTSRNGQQAPMTQLDPDLLVRLLHYYRTAFGIPPPQTPWASSVPSLDIPNATRIGGIANYTPANEARNMIERLNRNMESEFGPAQNSLAKIMLRDGLNALSRILPFGLGFSSSSASSAATPGRYAPGEQTRFHARDGDGQENILLLTTCSAERHMLSAGWWGDQLKKKLDVGGVKLPKDLLTSMGETVSSYLNESIKRASAFGG